MRSMEKISREHLHRLITFCETLQETGENPFDMDVKKSLTLLRRYLSQWETLDDLLLDGDAINEVSTIIKLQGNWVKNRSSLLYIDPQSMEEHLGALGTENLADIFLSSWHPILSIERLTPQRLKEGIDYWNAILPYGEKKMVFPPREHHGSLSYEDLVQLNIFGDEFQGLLKDLHEELTGRGPVGYWDFISGDTYEQTVMRAYLTSFLITEGDADLEVHPLEEEMTLYAQKRTGSRVKKKPQSIPVAISYEEWKKHGRGPTDNS